jgi:hypothetical protein
VVFHFNKKHLEDSTIPMWVVKARGETYYVHHVDCSVPWSTKETPDNAHTKGSIKIKRCLLTIDTDNCAVITALGEADAARLSNTAKVIRVITAYGKKLKDFLHNRSHGEIKLFGGGCGTAWYVTDLHSEKVLLLAQVAIPDLRVLMPNETYYQHYDKTDYVELDDEDWEDFYQS